MGTGPFWSDSKSFQICGHLPPALKTLRPPASRASPSSRWLYPPVLSSGPSPARASPLQAGLPSLPAVSAQRFLCRSPWPGHVPPGICRMAAFKNRSPELSAVTTLGQLVPSSVTEHPLHHNVCPFRNQFAKPPSRGVEGTLPRSPPPPRLGAPRVALASDGLAADLGVPATILGLSGLLA